MRLDAALQAELLATAHVLADAAGSAVLPYFRRPDLIHDNKLSSGFDPVTEADREAERVMLEILAERRPDDAVLGEEFGTRPGSTGLTWILDPIDGTRGFISGTPTWGVLVALCDREGPLIGIIDQPYTAERFVGAPGLAELTSSHGRRSLATRPPRSLSDAIVFTTFPEVGTAEEERAFRAVSAASRLTRYGMDCYAYALVAAGQVDLVIEAGLQPYDIAAPIAVIEAAGGLVTDWAGAPAHGGGRVIAAANAQVHAQALDLLKTALA